MADNDVYHLWLASPYGQVHRQAAQSKAGHKPQFWHNNPYKILDTEEILYPDGGMRPHGKIVSRVAITFKSRWNMRHDYRYEILENIQPPAYGSDVERDAMVDIIQDALENNFLRTKKTSKQKQVIVLAREAEQLGMTPTTYISEQLGIHRQSAWERLKRAKILTFEGSNDIISIEREAKKGLARTCCYCGQSTQNGLRALCDECDKRFYYLEDYPLNFNADDLKRLINLSNAAHWQKVRENAA